MFQDATVTYYLREGLQPNKLVLGIPFYGQSFTLEDPDKNQLSSPTIGGGKAGEATEAIGILSYFEVTDVNRDEHFSCLPKKLRASI